MSKAIEVGDTLIGDDYPVFIITEVSINHNGDINLAKKLIDVAAVAGCNAVKFQKRNLDEAVPEELEIERRLRKVYSI